MTSINSKSGNIVLQAEEVKKSVRLGSDHIQILNGISLTLHEGNSVAIVGPSGSGKTTLLGILAGLDFADSGTITLLNQSIAGMTEDQRASLRCGNVGFVFQSFHLLPNLTALENVSLALEVDPGSENIVQRSRAALNKVRLENRASHLPSQLSGGEQQRVALARSIVVDPKILFADEPTGNLDFATSHQIEETMFALCKDYGAALVLVTHNQNLARKCDEQITIEAGIRVN